MSAKKLTDCFRMLLYPSGKIPPKNCDCYSMKTFILAANIKKFLTSSNNDAYSLVYAKRIIFGGYCILFGVSAVTFYSSLFLIIYVFFSEWGWRCTRTQHDI